MVCSFCTSGFVCDLSVLKVVCVTRAVFYVHGGVLWRMPILVPVRECGGEKRKRGGELVVGLRSGH